MRARTPAERTNRGIPPPHAAADTTLSALAPLTTLQPEYAFSQINVAAFGSHVAHLIFNPFLNIYCKMTRLKRKQPKMPDLIAYLLLIYIFPSLISLSMAQSVYRSISGNDNNARNPTLGAVNTPFNMNLTTNPDTIVDAAVLATAGVAALTSGPPSARVISERISRNLQNPGQNPRNLTDFVTYWAEFMALDMSHTAVNRTEPNLAPIFLDSADPLAKAANTTTTGPIPPGIPFIPFFRGEANGTAGTPPSRQIINSVTHFLDASQIYGSAETVTNQLRAGPKFNLNERGLPQKRRDADSLSSISVPVLVGSGPSGQYLLGTVGGNTSPNLQALNILFMREHNWRVDKLKAQNPSWNDETLFQEARKLTVALYQKICYYEYLPQIMNENPLPLYDGYKSNVDPRVDSFFVSAAFRYGHSEISSTQRKAVDRSSSGSSDQQLSLNELSAIIFFNTREIDNNGIFPFLLGMARQIQQNPGLYYTESIRNQLFGNTPLDLFAIDIQRTRDFDLPSYNTVRQRFGLAPASTFSDITKDASYASALTTAYNGNITQLDAFVGGLAEPHVAGANFGELFARSIAQQFQATRDGDRFWFENPGVLSEDQLFEIRNTTFRQVILRNIAGGAYSELSEKEANETLSLNPWQFQVQRRLNPLPNNGMFSQDFMNRAYRMSYQVEGAGNVGNTSGVGAPSSETLRVILQCASEGWCGLGFGSSMQDAEFVVGRIENGKVVVEEFRSSGRFSRPQPLPSTARSSISVSSATYADGVMTIDFRRPSKVDPSASSAKNLLLKNQDILWAYNPTRPIGDQWFHAHGPATRGTLRRFNFFANGNTIESRGIEMTPLRLAHGWGMATLWGLLFPFGAFWARFMRHTQNWAFVHIALQSTGILTTIILFASVISKSDGESLSVYSPHSYLGILLMVLLVGQTGLGVLNNMGFTSESMTFSAVDVKVPRKGSGNARSHSQKAIIRLIHRGLGSCMLLMGFVQMALGLNILLPFGASGNTLGAWVALIVVVLLWLLAYSATELYYWRYVRGRQPSGSSTKYQQDSKKISTIGDKNGAHSQEQQRNPVSGAQNNNTANGNTKFYAMWMQGHQLQASRLMAPQHDAERPSNGVFSWIGAHSAAGPTYQNAGALTSPMLPKYTWETIDEAVRQGELLIVGDNRWVYDIKPWFKHHPGGQVVLQMVAGTDVTIDFFNESDFDGTAIAFDGLQTQPAGTMQSHSRTDVILPKFAHGRTRSLNSDFNSVGGDSLQNLEHEIAMSAQSNAKQLLEQQMTSPSSLSQTSSLGSVGSGLRLFNDRAGPWGYDILHEHPTLSREDWTVVKRSRKLHYHSRFAVKKLVGFCVGEIEGVAESRVNGVDEHDVPRPPKFDALEYRRYVMTSRTLLSEGTDGKRPIYCLKFCLVYPLSGLRSGEPDRFLPGQHMEIQDIAMKPLEVDNSIVSVQPGKPRVARYYHPFSGCPAAFEIFVRINPDGALTPNFLKRPVGSWQFKIRGPFGTPLINSTKPPMHLNHGPSWFLPPQSPSLPSPPASAPSSPQHRLLSSSMSSDSLLSSDSAAQPVPVSEPMSAQFVAMNVVQNAVNGTGCWDYLVLISGGTGITPFLQLLKQYFLPDEGRAVIAHDTFEPGEGAVDEIKLNRGDIIKVKCQYGDGWASGINLTTNSEGVFPVSFVIPLVGLKAKVILINCVSTLDDIVGKDILKAALNAYPWILRVVHVVSRQPSLNGESPAQMPPEHNLPNSIGEFRFGRLDAAMLNELVKDDWERFGSPPPASYAYPASQQAFFEASRHVMVCGPVSLTSATSDLVMEHLGTGSQELSVLPLHSTAGALTQPVYY
ncbi:hypothetical protein HK102_013685 [Quaeritorhiza haematococci]|nr:hypothetical protein HK102_013685 [Quaeritorhiza haematococci]